MRWLLIDRILECEPGISAKGIKTFPRSDMIFIDHFPGLPIVPGVLQIEMIAQMAGKCASLAKPGILPVLGSVKSVKFYRNVHPGDQCIIHAQIEKISISYINANGWVEVDGKKVCSASILFGVVDRTKINSESFDSVTQEWLQKTKQRLEASV
jgi:3-hydroxyacyl-[acyl-carrier-protein] dehydratase